MVNKDYELGHHCRVYRHSLTRGHDTQVSLTPLSAPGKGVLIHVIFKIKILQNISPKIWVKIYLKHCSKKNNTHFILSQIYRDQNKLASISFIIYILYKNLVHRR